MTEESPTLTDDDSEYDGRTSPPPASTIRTRAKTNRIKIETPKPHVTLYKKSLKPKNVEKIKLRKPSINSLKNQVQKQLLKNQVVKVKVHQKLPNRVYQRNQQH